MILVTGAAGKTGAAVMQALTRHPNAVRALIRRENDVESVLQQGADEALVGNFEDLETLRTACRGVRAIYHIPPNVHPKEVQFAKNLLGIARSLQVDQFVYHSVLHPQIEAMPHHWQKMRVEELIFTSGIDFTILQPCAYMQNIGNQMDTIIARGVYTVPYDLEARLSLVDLADVAEVAATVLTQPGHRGAVYELAGPQFINQHEIAEALSRTLNAPIKTRKISISAWREAAESNGLSAYAIEALIQMFKYYDQHGLRGNPQILNWLLGRQPTTFSQYLHQSFTPLT